MDAAELTQNVLMYFVLPLWLAAGFADYLCHRHAHIETTSGAKESPTSFAAIRGNGGRRARSHVPGNQRTRPFCDAGVLLFA